MQVVHVSTSFKTTFGVIDDDGNVILKEVIEGEVDRLYPNSFMEVLRALMGKKMQMKTRYAEASIQPLQPIKTQSTNGLEDAVRD